MARDISHLGADLTAKVDRIDKALQRSIQGTVVKAAEAGVAAQRALIVRDSGGDSRLSGVGRRRGRTAGAKVGARFRLTNRGTTAVSAEISATGPLPLIANPTKPHVIRSAYRGRSSRSVINIPGIGFRHSAQHPGTRGKDTWDRGRTLAGPAMGRVIGRETDQAFRWAAT